MKIAIACDHAGFELKEFIKKNIPGHEFKDFGTNDSESVDYPDYAHPLAKSVTTGESATGILICGSGNGACMTANKHEGIRAALCWTVELGELARLHNDANVLCLPARFISQETALEITLKFLSTAFEGGRHQNRVNKITR